MLWEGHGSAVWERFQRHMHVLYFLDIHIYGIQSVPNGTQCHEIHLESMSINNFPYEFRWNSLDFMELQSFPYTLQGDTPCKMLRKPLKFDEHQWMSSRVRWNIIDFHWLINLITFCGGYPLVKCNELVLLIFKYKTLNFIGVQQMSLHSWEA